MGNSSSNYLIKTGLLAVALTWFLFTFYQFPKAAINIGQMNFWVFLTDTAGVIGLGFRTVASFFAVITILFFIFKRDLSKPEAMMSVRWIILGEAIAIFTLFPSGIWGMLSVDRLGFLIETGIPCLVESILLPIVLIKLFFELNPNKAERRAIKWGMITGTAYIFVFWLNNTVNWVYALMQKGTEYITSYPLNMLSFALTTIGLLALTVYAAYFTKKSSVIETIQKLDFRRVGAIVTALGLYFVTIYLLWIYLGSIGGWGAWYAWFLGHNMDLWLMSLPMAGVPLLLHHQE
jgi:hypothetical protein